MSTHAGTAIAQISLLMDMEAMLALLHALQLDAHMDILAAVVLGEGHIALDLAIIRLHGPGQIGYGLDGIVALSR